MKAALSSITFAAFSLIVSVPAHAAELVCSGAGSPLTFTAQSAPWCESGLQLLNVETRCIIAQSPAFHDMTPGRSYHGCVSTQLERTGQTYEARIERVELAD